MHMTNGTCKKKENDAAGRRKRENTLPEGRKTEFGSIQCSISALRSTTRCTMALRALNGWHDLRFAPVSVRCLGTREPHKKTLYNRAVISAHRSTSVREYSGSRTNAYIRWDCIYCLPTKAAQRQVSTNADRQHVPAMHRHTQRALPVYENHSNTQPQTSNSQERPGGVCCW